MTNLVIDDFLLFERIMIEFVNFTAQIPNGCSTSLKHKRYTNKKNSEEWGNDLDVQCV